MRTKILPRHRYIHVRTDDAAEIDKQVNRLARRVSAIAKEIVLLRDRRPDVCHFRDGRDRAVTLGAPDGLAEAEQILELLDHEETEKAVNAAALEVRPVHADAVVHVRCKFAPDLSLHRTQAST